MKYQAPFGSVDPDAPYVDRNVPGAVVGSKVPAAAIEDPQRELANLIAGVGLTPDEADLHQVAKAIQSNRMNFATAGGTANALTATLTPAPAALVAGLRASLIVPAINTSATVTLNVNGLGAVAVVRRNTNSLGIGDIQAGLNDFEYDGTYWRLMSAPFGQSLISGSGWIDLSGGLTMQWGSGNTSSGSQTVTFPKAFSAVPYTVVGIDRAASGWSTSNASFLGTAAISASQCTFRSVTWNGSGMILTTTSFAWLAVGPT